ncbi:hypothetical protein F5Y16DRAFT_373785 [Xylariaceae sp. FL0255]|nr:hypothetical protein F5Y16DRAFT_373785 [Xylariaceae sp. FL0255]
MKFSAALSVLALVGASVATPHTSRGYPTTKYPTTHIAGLEVIDTPLVRDVRKLIEEFNELQPYLYKHLMRTWLWGVAAMNANETLKGMIDPELQAVGTMMHDMGWDMRPNSPYVTLDQRFEADSGLAAMNYVKANPHAHGWDEARLERMYIGIALQIEKSLVSNVNFNSQFIVQCVEWEIPGPRDPRIPEKDYNNILAAYPNHYATRGTNATFTWFAAHKPAGTYNNAMEAFGTENVPGYNATGHRLYDTITANAKAEALKYPDATIYD